MSRDIGPSKSHGSIAALLALIALFSLSAGCHVVDSKDWNLRQLHDNQGHHQYTGALEGDFQYFWRQKVAAPLLSAGSTLAVKTPKHIDDPAGECLETLVELEDFDASDPRVAGLQVQWFSRLAAEDPWKLSRERAVLALGRAGRRLEVGVPVGLPPGAQPTGPEALGSALASLIKSARPILEKGKHAGEMAEIDLDASCQVVEHMTLDIDGARRALLVAVDLTRSAGLNNQALAPVWRMSENLQRTCVRLGLAAGLTDRDPVVRAASIEASVACAGSRVLLPVLAQLSHEPTPEVVLRVMKLVREVGLPEPASELSPADRELARTSWLAAIYQLVQGRPESEVRVSAMLTLSKISGAKFASLREEDWQAWWLARQTPPADATPSGSGSPNHPGSSNRSGPSAESTESGPTP